MEDNLFMMVYCLRSAERMNNNIIITAVDLAKSFDTQLIVPLWNLSSRNRVTPVSIQDGV